MKIFKIISGAFFSIWLAVAIIFYLAPFRKFPHNDIGEGFIKDWYSSFTGEKRSDTEEDNELRNKNNMRGLLAVVLFIIVISIIK